MTPKHRATQARAFKRRYQARKAAGLCVRCGRLPAAPGKARCQICTESVNEANKHSRDKRRKEKKDGQV